MYVRFPLSLRNVEDLLHERGIDISHETGRYWWNRFGPMYAAEIRRMRVSRMRAQPPDPLLSSAMQPICHLQANDGSTDDPAPCRLLNASIIPITVPNNPSSGGICAMVSRIQAYRKVKRELTFSLPAYFRTAPIIPPIKAPLRAPFLPPIRPPAIAPVRAPSSRPAWAGCGALTRVNELRMRQTEAIFPTARAAFLVLQLIEQSPRCSTSRSSDCRLSWLPRNRHPTDPILRCPDRLRTSVQKFATEVAG